MAQIKKWNWQQSDWPNWQFDANVLAGFEDQFLLRSGRLLGAWAHLVAADQDQVAVHLLSDEALKTSEIEGEYLDPASVQSSVRRQFGLTADRRAGAAEAGIAELMVACYNDFATPLSDEMFFNWHSLICNGRTDLAVIGGYRAHEDPMQVVSGPTYKPNIHFEAPASVHMKNEMAQFVNWGNETHLPALTKAGLIHLYFVSIHPFEDGNGRVARALSEKILAQAIGAPNLIALSRQIEKNRGAYYVQLEANNKVMEVTDWLRWFAETVLKAQEYSMAMIEHLIAKTKLLDRMRGELNARQEKAVIRIYDAGPDGFEGGLSAKNYMSITDAAPATARRDLGDLVVKGVLRRTGDLKVTRYWLVG